jgi:sugar phosphate isomerase/epimerase
LAPALYISYKRDQHEDAFQEWLENAPEVSPEETSLGLIWEMVPDLPAFATLANTTDLSHSELEQLRRIQIELGSQDDTGLTTHLYTDGGFDEQTLESTSGWQVRSASGICIASGSWHHWPVASPFDAEVLAATKGHPNLGACADIGHWGRNGLDPVECLKKLEGHVVSLHFKDIKEMNKVDAGDMIPGTGVLNMPAIFAELKRQGFKGTLSIEHEDNWYNNVPDVKRIVEYYNAEVGKLK